MDLKEFISDTLTQICDGVKDSDADIVIDMLMGAEEI